ETSLPKRLRPRARPRTPPNQTSDRRREVHRLSANAPRHFPAKNGESRRALHPIRLSPHRTLLRQPPRRYSVHGTDALGKSGVAGFAFRLRSGGQFGPPPDRGDAEKSRSEMLSITEITITPGENI